MVQKSLNSANIQQNEISAIGFTRGPGFGLSWLELRLQRCSNVPRYSFNRGKPPTSAYFGSFYRIKPSPPKFPFLCLTVSGGHTMIVLVKDYFDMEIIGKSIVMPLEKRLTKWKNLRIDYPAGIIDQLAQNGNPNAFQFGKPKLEKNMTIHSVG